MQDLCIWQAKLVRTNAVHAFIHTAKHRVICTAQYDTAHLTMWRVPAGLPLSKSGTLQNVWWTPFPYLGIPIHLNLHVVLGLQQHPDAEHNDDLIFTFQEDHIFWVLHSHALLRHSLSHAHSQNTNMDVASMSWFR